MEQYLQATEVMDINNPVLIEHADLITAGKKDLVSMAVKLYYFVRDYIRYDPYTHFHKIEYYKASRVLDVGRGNCICKAVLLCALCRILGIPSRLGFADVKNHLATKQLLEFIGSKIFLFHGYAELYLGNKWVIATPAFNSDLCKRHNVIPLDFDGYSDSIFQAYNLENKMYMEYVRHHGSFHDLPLNRILSAWKKGYGKERVMEWAKNIEREHLASNRDFYKEDIFCSGH